MSSCNEPERAACRGCARKVPWVSLCGNLGLAIFKLIVGVLGSSAALVADSFHSFADVIGSSGIVVATRVSARKPSPRFPYGTGKAEFIGAAFVYTILLFFAAGITYSAVVSIINPAHSAPHFATVLGAVVSVGYNFVMYKYAYCVGTRNRSPAILADAFENRAGAISSVACIVGILGAMVIHPVCDALAALFVGLLIFWHCTEQLQEAARGLMDRALPADAVEAIRVKASEMAGVADVTFVRTRMAGPRYWVDLGIALDADLPVAKADQIASAVRAAVRQDQDCYFVEVYVTGPVKRARKLPVIQESLAS